MSQPPQDQSYPEAFRIACIVANAQSATLAYAYTNFGRETGNIKPKSQAIPDFASEFSDYLVEDAVALQMALAQTDKEIQGPNRSRFCMRYWEDAFANYRTIKLNQEEFEGVDWVNSQEAYDLRQKAFYFAQECELYADSEPIAAAIAAQQVRYEHLIVKDQHSRAEGQQPRLSFGPDFPIVDNARQGDTFKRINSHLGHYPERQAPVCITEARELMRICKFGKRIENTPQPKDPETPAKAPSEFQF